MNARHVHFIRGGASYLPELQATNPRVRDMGRRMALNAPIQGGAADIMKMAMIRVSSASAVSLRVVRQNLMTAKLQQIPYVSPADRSAARNKNGMRPIIHDVLSIKS